MTQTPLRRRRLKIFLWLSLALLIPLTLAAVAFGSWLYRLDQSIATRLQQKRFASPLEFYSKGERYFVGGRVKIEQLKQDFLRLHLRERKFGQPLQPGDFAEFSADECRQVLQNIDLQQIPVSKCFGFRDLNTMTSPTDQSAAAVQILALDPEGVIVGTYEGEPPHASLAFAMPNELFAQYYGDVPILRKVVALGEAPPMCLNALMAIEDANFLEHQGVSWTGMARAMIRNFRSGRVTQGGSTLTQQLIKNYFLTDERTIKRKVNELFMSLLIETHASKDDILETYINLIYMGQNGPFQVRGFAAASEHYFAQPLSDLKLDQCALMAAIVNSPGLFNPFIHPDSALKRRTKVLDRMSELKMISAEEATAAKAASLPNKPQRSLTEPAPYYVQAVRRELVSRGIDTTDGAKVVTGLSLRAQEAAQQAVRRGLEKLESSSLPIYAKVNKLKASGKNLESVLIGVDPTTGLVQALVGGRGFTATQFNRAVDGRRQIGSVMKPVVYLTALETKMDDGKPYSPLTMIEDTSFTHKYGGGQSWSPKNYDGAFNGSVPMYFAVKESLNSATAQLGLKVGLNAIVDVARRLGVTSALEPVPSLTLGAFEMAPMEVAQVYTTLSRLGSFVRVSLIESVENFQGEKLYVYDATPEVRVSPETTSMLVGMMKQTLETGTARGARAMGFNRPAAGKTGTTNDKKDAWFAGYTPLNVAIVWVGYDDNTSHGLTGASGSVPIWTDYMNQVTGPQPESDFHWPESVRTVQVSEQALSTMNVRASDLKTATPLQLIFASGIDLPSGTEEIKREGTNP